MSSLDARFIHIKDDKECICDVCIQSYLDLYHKIEALQEVLFRWKANLSKAERDKINQILKPKEPRKKK